MSPISLAWQIPFINTISPNQESKIHLPLWSWQKRTWDSEIKILQIRSPKNKIYFPKGSSTGLSPFPTADQTLDKSLCRYNRFVNPKSLPTAYQFLSVLIFQRLIQLILVELHKSMNIHKYFSIQIQIITVLLRTNETPNTVFKKINSITFLNPEYQYWGDSILLYLCVLLLVSYSAAIPLAAGLN